MNGGSWMAGTKRLFCTHDIHTQYIISSHSFHSSFKWCSIRYEITSDHPLVPRILPCDAVDRGCVHLPSCRRTATRFRFVHKIQTFSTGELAHFAAQTWVHSQRDTGLSHLDEEHLKRSHHTTCYSRLCAMPARWWSSVLEVFIKHAGTLCLTTTGLVASVMSYNL